MWATAAWSERTAFPMAWVHPRTGTRLELTAQRTRGVWWSSGVKGTGAAHEPGELGLMLVESSLGMASPSVRSARWRGPYAWQEHFAGGDCLEALSLCHCQHCTDECSVLDCCFGIGPECGAPSRQATKQQWLGWATACLTCEGHLFDAGYHCQWVHSSAQFFLIEPGCVRRQSCFAVLKAVAVADLCGC